MIIVQEKKKKKKKKKKRESTDIFLDKSHYEGNYIYVRTYVHM